MFYAIASGFPVRLAGHELHLKSLNAPFVLCLLFVLAGIAMHARRVDLIKTGMRKVESFTSKPRAIWMLFGAAAALFLWQQISLYLSVKIHFLPFSFYDYMLFNFFQGKINYTGLLHGYYHVNNALYLLAPVWYFFQSPLVLVVVYGILAAAAILPLYGIARKRFQEPVAPFVIAFVYLNYRYVKNLLQVGFSVEILYPLFIFSALYCAMDARWLPYYFFLLLGLSVKEDSFLYFSALGVLLFFLRSDGPPSRPWRESNRVHGLATVGISILYIFFIAKIFIPVTGNTIVRGDLENFQSMAASVSQIVVGILERPLAFFEVLFGSEAKLRTYLMLLSYLAFLPLLSPAALLILVPIFPMYFHNTGRDMDFVDLRFHYSAAVIPFVFIALVFGFSNLYRKVPGMWKNRCLWGGCLILVLLNGGRYRTEKITREDLQSIRWAKSIPAGANVVTHGHLLPYLGYRPYNYYFAAPWELQTHPLHRTLMNADYYLIDFNVNPYPMNRGYLECKIRQLEGDARYELLRADDGTRFLFKRKAAAA